MAHAMMAVTVRTNAGSERTGARQRNLGVAILLEAIADYRSIDQDLHESAARFLYPQSATWKNHYDWAVGLAADINADWLRGALDRARGKWDAHRLTRKVLRKHLPGRS